MFEGVKQEHERWKWRHMPLLYPFKVLAGHRGPVRHRPGFRPVPHESHRRGSGPGVRRTSSSGRRRIARTLRQATDRQFPARPMRHAGPGPCCSGAATRSKGRLRRVGSHPCAPALAEFPQQGLWIHSRGFGSGGGDHHWSCRNSSRERHG